jgi:hypothetical protein
MLNQLARLIPITTLSGFRVGKVNMSQLKWTNIIGAYSKNRQKLDHDAQMNDQHAKASFTHRKCETDDELNAIAKVIMLNMKPTA